MQIQSLQVSLYIFHYCKKIIMIYIIIIIIIINIILL